jgi:hypothetical protein
MANKAQPKRQGSDQKRRYFDVVKVVMDVATIKGWNAEHSRQDDRFYKYATVHLSKFDGFLEVEASIEIIVDLEVKYSIISNHESSAALNIAIENELKCLPWLKENLAAIEAPRPQTGKSIGLVIRYLRNFHRVSRQLERRRNGRQPFRIQDEYDLQDFLHAFLKGLFADVRAEEATPSYAGGASRMDFLLKREKVVIETKMTSATLRDRQVGEQLLVDIGRYAAHPACERLICFVYDPAGNLKNGHGLEQDLSRSYNDLDVTVVVSPK